jgi:hypothetical protein
MIAVFSRRALGRVEVIGGTFLVTSFWCINLLPIVPSETHLVTARAPDGACTSVKVPMHLASVLAGYARTWGVMASVVSLFVVLVADDAAERGRGLLALALSAVVCAVAWLLLGRLSAEERARRAMYRSIIDLPIDPVWLPDDRRSELAGQLRAELSMRALSLARASYRDAPEAAWETVALDPAVNDTSFLARAAVLARIQARDADRAERRRLQRVHDEAWKRAQR